MEKQITAVDWLIDKIEDHFCLLPVDLIEQAKEMEKQQIINAWDLGRRDIDYPINGEQYYNKKFKNK